MTRLQLEQISLIYGEGETALEALTGITSGLTGPVIPVRRVRHIDPTEVFR